MRKRSYLLLLGVFVALIIYSQKTYAQVALNAPPDDRVYQAIDVLIASGLANDVIIGQRPFSRLEVARILKEARKKLDTQRNEFDVSNHDSYAKLMGKWNYLDRLLSHYEKKYRLELQGMPKGMRAEILSELDITYLYNSSKPRLIPASNGQGNIDAVATSFDHYSQGLTYVDGVNNFIS
ncbi:MAG: hypothetical protein ABH859_07220, partial [Pseudomonadota bacterium]